MAKRGPLCTKGRQQNRHRASKKRGAMRAKGGPQNAKCTYKGVRQRTWGTWVAEIRPPKKRSRIWLGSFRTSDDAARAYNKSAIELHGEKAHINIIPSDAALGTSSRPTPAYSSLAETFLERLLRDTPGSAPAVPLPPELKLFYSPYAGLCNPVSPEDIQKDHLRVQQEYSWTISDCSSCTVFPTCMSTAVSTTAAEVETLGRGRRNPCFPTSSPHCNFEYDYEDEVSFGATREFQKEVQEKHINAGEPSCSPGDQFNSLQMIVMNAELISSEVNGHQNYGTCFSTGNKFVQNLEEQVTLCGELQNVVERLQPSTEPSNSLGDPEWSVDEFNSLQMMVMNAELISSGVNAHQNYGISFSTGNNFVPNLAEQVTLGGELDNVGDRLQPSLGDCSSNTGDEDDYALGDRSSNMEDGDVDWPDLLYSPDLYCPEGMRLQHQQSEAVTDSEVSVLGEYGSDHELNMWADFQCTDDDEMFLTLMSFSV